jgi:thioredoxin reductase (NADPH)
MCQAAYQIINPGKKYVLKYQSQWVRDGDDGRAKKHQKQTIV